MKDFSRYNDNLSKETRIVLYEEKIKTRKARGKPKGRRDMIITDNYNVLKNLGLVRRYIQKKYDLDYLQFEMIQWLYTLSYFSFWDFMRYPTNWGPTRWYDMVDKGYIKEVFPDRKLDRIFTLSHQGKHIVALTHQYLLEKAPIPINPDINRVMLKNASSVDKRHQTAMREFRENVKNKLEEM
jgi:hypothetical protein